jgi:peptidylprolyl isomerase
MKKIIFTLLLTLANLFAANPHVVLETTQGKIELELYKDVAPLAVENFITHIKDGYYNGVAFHRIIKDFMIQGGDPTESGRGGESIWKKPFKDEFKNKTFDKAGILAMANAGRNTNGSQFFINTASNNSLDTKHTVFGKVVEGMDAVTKIENTETGENDRPVEPQVIESIEIK